MPEISLPSSADLESILETCLADTERVAGDHLSSGILLNNIGVLYHELGQLGSADIYYKRALSNWERLVPLDHALVAQSLFNRASLYRQMEFFAEAERVFQLALHAWRAAGWPPVPDSQKADYAAIHYKPLWWECPDFRDGQKLPKYGASVRALRKSIENNAPDAGKRLRETLQRLGPWMQNIDLGCGISTKPDLEGFPNSDWCGLMDSMPADLSGMTVLDMCCNSGFFALKMKERNAARVVGIETELNLLAQARFLAHWFDYAIELYQLDVYNVDRLQMRFDVITFIGRLYRLKHPLYALEKAAAVCNGTMLVQTVLKGSDRDFNPKPDYSIGEDSIFNHPDFPRLFFVEKSYNGDAGNWWFATRSCFKAMLRVAGFDTVKDTSVADTFLCSDPRPSMPLDDDTTKVKEFWGSAEAHWEEPKITFWMQHPKVIERLNRFASGDPMKDRFNYFMEKYCAGRMPFDRVITLGCGRGDLERGLAQYNFARSHDAVDIADGAITIATRLAAEAGLTHTSYRVADLNKIELPKAAYDVVMGISSVHHTVELERLFEQVSNSLKPGGYFFLDEFIGPTKFQWPDDQLAAINDALSAMPAKYRRCVDRRKGMKGPLARLTIDEMNQMDPSEAVRSAEILPLLERVFDIVEIRGCGGSLLHLLLDEIAGNFSEQDPQSLEYLGSLFELEDRLIGSGRLQHDFAVIIARNR